MSSNLPAERHPDDAGVPATQVKGAPLPALPAALGVDGHVPTEPEAPAVNPQRVMAAFLRYKWMVLGMSLVGGAAGYAANKVLVPTYETQATIWMEQGGGSSGPITNGPPVLP